EEDGIRDWSVTGVQTCALPICHGVKILPIDVVHSQWQCTLEQEEVQTWAVRMGLWCVNGLGVRDGDTITTTREAGAYHSLADFRSEERRVGKEGRTRAWPESEQ